MPEASTKWPIGILAAELPRHEGERMAPSRTTKRRAPENVERSELLRCGRWTWALPRCGSSV